MNYTTQSHFLLTKQAHPHQTKLRSFIRRKIATISLVQTISQFTKRHSPKLWRKFINKLYK